MTDASEQSLGGEATFAGGKRPQRADVSIGDERTLGDGLSGQETILDDIEVVDLEARYRVEGTLGQGGMGAVLLATDTRLDRKVAIKRILGEAAGNRMAVNRFLTEAKSIAALNHPNVVQIYDYGRANDGPFLIMEYVDGGSLLDRCHDGAIPFESAVDLACQLCDGLAKAHDVGIIHRDIKPANVLLTKDGTPKLTDFGLAKAQAGDHGQTMTGAVLGTPDFMPPEQRRDASLVDHRSDLWSLAATVYQMVTGRSPKIIRFDLLPAELTKVLGKALEDAKDDRYQTARELRDSLKACLRAASADSPATAEGQCPSCGVQNDASRRFCRGCGGSLEIPCLSCDKPMPIGEEICGSCGSKQTPLLEARRSTMAAEQAKAEGLLGDFAFDEAARIATRLRDEPHPRLSHLKAWAEAFLGEVGKSRSHQTDRAAESLFEASKHEEASDYLSAIFALESVPPAMRSVLLPGARETVDKVLDRLKKTQAEARRLESLVKERVAAKSLDGLLVEVERLLRLQPDRSDIQKLKVQLLDRQSRQAASRDKAVASATALLDAHDYEAALATLSAVPPSASSSEVASLLKRANTLVAEVRGLATKIREAVSAKQLDGLLETIDAYLQLKPADPDVLKLRQSLVTRDEKFAAEIAARLERARRLEQACQFEEAQKSLTAIPDARRSDDVTECLDRTTRLASVRKAAIELLGKAGPQTYTTAIESSRMYEAAIADAGIADGDFTALLSKAEVALAREERMRKILKRAGIVAAAVAAVVVLTVAGLWMRSSARSAALATALQEGSWNEALALDSENASALVGRAQGKLGATPPDIEGAFSDLDQANRTGREPATVKAARGDAHAARAREHAQGGKLDAAAQDLSEAQIGPASAEWIATAKTAVITAWISRAEEAGKRGDVKRLQQALSSAKTAGGIDQSLLAAWEEYASAQIQSLDAKGLELACMEGRKLGLSRAQEAAWWLEFGELGVEKGDEGALRVGADGWQALGLQPDADRSAAGLWKLQAAACLKRFDAKSLATACTEGGKNGLPSKDIAELWIRFAELAAKPPYEDGASVQVAANAARLAGASDDAVRPLQARGLMLEAIALMVKEDTKMAVGKALKASVLEPKASVAAIEKPANGALRTAVVADFRSRFDAGLAANDWDTVLRVAASARALEPKASGWVGEAIAKDTGLLSSVPPDALGRLPAAPFAAVPPAVIAALQPIRNSIGIELRFLPAGTFTMGQHGGNWDETPHEVTLSKSFYIGVYEVTNAQWKRVMGSVPSEWKDDDRPVEQVGRDDAVEFCKKLSALPEEVKAGRLYRLPTEAEWEYACRAGTDTKYSFGDDESRLGDYGWFDGNSSSQTYPVGKKKPNGWGLFDMHGNVWERCSDWHGAYPKGAVTDPLHLSTGQADQVLRGGGYYFTAEQCRSASRCWSLAQFRVGIRLAMSLSEVKTPEAVQ